MAQRRLPAKFVRKTSALATPAAPSATISSALSTFNSLRENGHISAQVRLGIPFDEMTPVQANTILPILSGADVLAQAKTGTGKTLAFLIPAIERTIRNPNPAGHVNALIIAPTRDLANQIGADLIKLTSHLPSVKCIVIFGGTNKKLDSNISDMKFNKPSIVVGQKMFLSVRTLIFDEADLLLDQGFLPDIKRIVSGITHQKNSVARQTLMFSATISKEIQKIAKFALKADFQFINTITSDDQPTHEKIKQSMIIVPDTTFFDAAYAVIKKNLNLFESPKIIVFLPTARMAQLSASLFQSKQLGMNIPIFDIHSRLSPSRRENNCRDFKAATSAIIFSSDVIARGMDFPNVDLVIQIGLPQNRDQYLHRIGRTGRANAEGKSIIIVTETEKAWLRNLKDLDVSEDSIIPNATDHARVVEGMKMLSDEMKGQSWLGFYKGMIRDLNVAGPQGLVDSANQLAFQVLQCSEVPAISSKAVGMMGLKNCKGLLVVGNVKKASKDQARKEQSRPQRKRKSPQQS